MTSYDSTIDIVRERALYVEAVRRASALGEFGREALCDAHELYAAAMLGAERPELAADAVAALLAACPGCPSRLRLAARIARRCGDEVASARHAEAADRLERCLGVAVRSPRPEPSRFKASVAAADKSTGVA